MKILFAGLLTVILVAACGLHAQDANPISANMKQSWTNIRDLLTRMADKMPAEDYRFKPTPEMQDFGQRVAHVIGFNMRACAQMMGHENNLNLGTAPSRAEVVAAMKQANAECDGVFNTLTDAELVKMVPAGRGGERLKLALLQGNVLEHSQEMYGYLAVYLRLKGIVPPSSDRNER